MADGENNAIVRFDYNGQFIGRYTRLINVSTGEEIRFSQPDKIDTPYWYLRLVVIDANKKRITIVKSINSYSGDAIICNFVSTRFTNDSNVSLSSINYSHASDGSIWSADPANGMFHIISDESGYVGSVKNLMSSTPQWTKPRTIISGAMSNSSSQFYDFISIDQWDNSSGFNAYLEGTDLQNPYVDIGFLSSGFAKIGATVYATSDVTMKVYNSSGTLITNKGTLFGYDAQKGYLTTVTSNELPSSIGKYRLNISLVPTMNYIYGQWQQSPLVKDIWFAMPLLGNVSGPSFGYSGNSLSFNLNMTSGSGQFSYKWLRQDDGISSWNIVGSSSTNLTQTMGNKSFKIMCEVTDLFNGNVMATNTIFVSARTISGTLASNEVWSGNIDLAGQVTVPTNLTLTIQPGTIISFPSTSSLFVNGKLNAIGTSGNQIIFTSESGTSPNSWGSITLNGTESSGSRIEYSTIQYGARIEAINSSNILIQNCNIINTYDGIRFSGSTGSVLNNIITSSSIGHGIIIENSSTATCNQNIITKTNPSKYGVGILYRGGANGELQLNDISGWDWGVGAIFGSSPSFSTPINGKNNRIRNCNTGVKAYESSWPTIGIPTSGIGYNSIHSNVYYSVYFASGGTLNAWRTYWNGTPVIYSEGGTVRTDLALSEDPWLGIAKASSDTEELERNDQYSIIGENPPLDKSKLYYGIDLRLQNKLIEAKDFFISYIAKNPDDQAAYVELYNCYNNETADDIIRFFSTLPKEAAKEHTLLLSYLYLKSGDINMARKVNNAIINERLNNQVEMAARINNIYIALYNENNFDMAINYFSEVAAKNLLTNSIELSLVKQALESYARLYGIDIKQFNFSKSVAETAIPEKFELLGNYPNPFNPSTTILYNLPFLSSVELIIYDIMGREVQSFINASQPAGKQSIMWDGTNHNGEVVASGVYLYRIRLKSLENSENFVTTAKLMLLK